VLTDEGITGIAEVARDFTLERLLDRAYGADEMRAALAGALSGVQDEAGLESVLRQFRQREMVRLIWRDLSGLASLDETLDELSELADVCIRQALDRLHDWAVAKSGVPRGSDGGGVFRWGRRSRLEDLQAVGRCRGTIVFPGRTFAYGSRTDSFPFRACPNH